MPEPGAEFEKKRREPNLQKKMLNDDGSGSSESASRNDLKRICNQEHYRDHTTALKRTLRRYQKTTISMDTLDASRTENRLAKRWL